MLSTHDIRKKYLSYFADRTHAVLPSSSLVPENDPTTLFTGSGMQPMVPYLLGEKHPAGKRLVDSQKCFRSQDIEEVGDNRHTTFFEMLGNWSLGAYFKQEQIPWMYEFLTKELKLDANRLYVTFFQGNEALGIPRDDESANLWQFAFTSQGIEANIVDDAETKGLQGGRIFSYSEKKNWWSRAGVPDNMPVGEPGGPDTEMFWDFGADLRLHELSAWKDEPCHVNCDCGRFLEIGNNVFMEYRKTADGFEPLPQKNVDFGGGLERFAAALNNNPDVFQIDLFAKAKNELEKISGLSYGDHQLAFRVILDHLRAAVFLVADGVIPAKSDQGYVLRRLIRRAVFKAHQLKIYDPAWIISVSHAFVDTYQSFYPLLTERRDQIAGELHAEMTKFKGTLDAGVKVFNRIVAKSQSTINAVDAFELYQSHGFPIELTLEIAQAQGMTVDLEGFNQEMLAHQAKSREGAKQKFAGGLADTSEDTTKLHTATHLLHQALRMVLGDHVEQKGSNITDERLRFDFSHSQKMTPEQIAQVEAIVNEQIARDLPVRAEQLTVAEAKEKGAIGLFEDKYALVGDKINVYFIGDFSKEICGGPHVAHTGLLGGIKIQKEEASSAGVRRIKAVLGKIE